MHDLTNGINPWFLWLPTLKKGLTYIKHIVQISKDHFIPKSTCVTFKSVHAQVPLKLEGQCNRTNAR